MEIIKNENNQNIPNLQAGWVEHGHLEVHTDGPHLLAHCCSGGRPSYVMLWSCVCSDVVYTVAVSYAVISCHIVVLCYDVVLCLHWCCLMLGCCLMQWCCVIQWYCVVRLCCLIPSAMLCYGVFCLPQHDFATQSLLRAPLKLLDLPHHLTLFRIKVRHLWFT
jgi:hypothetical protein